MFELIAAFFTLSVLEIVLGIDNIIFLALLVDKLPEAQKKKARFIGLGLALILRVGLLLGINLIIHMEMPILAFAHLEFSGKDLLMLAGGLFLIFKSTSHIHEMFNHTEEHSLAMQPKAHGLTGIVLQIALIDLVFSFDSVITAVGMTRNIPLIIAAMTLAMGIMLFASKWVSDIVTTYPTLKNLALSFILMIGVMLVGEGFGASIPKGYIYFGMGFSLGVEVLNILTTSRKKKKE